METPNLWHAGPRGEFWTGACLTGPGRWGSPSPLRSTQPKGSRSQQPGELRASWRVAR